MRLQMEESIPPENGDLRNLRASYRSGRHDLARDFFAPCLSACQRYRRGAGYFTSASLLSWVGALPALMIEKRTSVDLLVAPFLRPMDLEALRGLTSEEGTALFQKRADELVLEAAGLEELGAQSESWTSDLLAWLVAHGVVELRFAFPSAAKPPGIYHEKIGIFDFPSGHQVAFTGSANETAGGHRRNFESLDVFRSWYPGDKERVDAKVEQFDLAWAGSWDGLTVLRLSEEALSRVKECAGDWELPPLDSPADGPYEERVSDSYRWRHQDEAIERFLNEQQGVLEMATGTGKTRTALRLVRELIERDEIDSVVISADGTALLEQWALELVAVAVEQDPSFRLLKHYDRHHDTDRFLADPSNSLMLVSRYALPGILSGVRDPSRLFLIHDEVHKLGSRGNRSSLASLSANIPWRLGLSATPEREYDEEGTDFIIDHVGPVIYSFSLSDAIERRVLCPFDYVALPYEPHQDDRDGIKRVYAKQAARRKEGRPMTKEEVWIELAKVYKTSKAKLPVFEGYVKRNPTVLERAIVFVETKQYGREVLPLIHEVHADFHTYFDNDEKSVLRRFARGDLSCLVTCHRLSEGIDIRDLASVVLFSSARARLETIQRMGRCLRADPEDPAKRATVVDFIRDEGDGAENADTERRDWLSDLAEVEPEEGVR